MAENPRESAEETARIVEDAFRSIAANIKDIFREGLESTDDYGKGLARDINNQLKSIARSQSELVNNADKLNKGELSSKEIAKQKLAIQQKINSVSRQIELAAGHVNDAEKELLRERLNSLEASRDITEELEKQLDIAKKTEKYSKSYTELSEAVKDIPGLRKLAGPFESMAKGAKKTAAELATGAKTAGKFSKGMIVAKGAMQGFGKGLKGSMLGKAGWIGLAVTLVQTLINGLLGANEQAVELSRNLGLNHTEAEKFKTTIDDIAFRGMTAAAANSKNVQKALFAQNKALGFNLQATIELTEVEKERLSQITNINETLGLSEQSFSNLLNLSRITGDSEKDILSTISSTVYQVGLQNKMMFNTREILEEVLQTSDSIALQFGFNVKEIAKATAEAKLLGFSLKDIEGTQSNMLNFESSIAAELEAEILTNKELNLERARAFALQGDLLSLGKELTREVGSFGEFMNMNILQQQALAKAVGMSREELTNVFKEQEKVRKIQSLMADEEFKQYAIKQLKMKGMEDLSDKAIEAFIKTGEVTGKYAQVLGDDLNASLARETAQQKFQRSLEALQDILNRLVNSNVLDYLANFIEDLSLAIAGGQSLGDMLLPTWLGGEGGIDKAAIEKGRAKLGTKNKAIEIVQQGTGAAVDVIRPVNDFIVQTNSNDKIGGVLDNDSVNRMISLLENINNQLSADRNIYMDGRLVGDAVAARSFK